MNGHDVRSHTTRVVNKETVYDKLDALDDKWMDCTLEDLLVKHWKCQGCEIKWGIEWNMDNPIRNMPVVTKRKTYVLFIIYSLNSPDRNLQLAIALVKSICKDYDRLDDIMQAGDYSCPTQIREDDPCTIIARDILSKLYN